MCIRDKNGDQLFDFSIAARKSGGFSGAVKGIIQAKKTDAVFELACVKHVEKRMMRQCHKFGRIINHTGAFRQWKQKFSHRFVIVKKGVAFIFKHDANVPCRCHFQHLSKCRGIRCGGLIVKRDADIFDIEQMCPAKELIKCGGIGNAKIGGKQDNCFVAVNQSRADVLHFTARALLQRFSAKVGEFDMIDAQGIGCLLYTSIRLQHANCPPVPRSRFPEPRESFLCDTRPCIDLNSILFLIIA